MKSPQNRKERRQLSERKRVETRKVYRDKWADYRARNAVAAEVMDPGPECPEIEDLDFSMLK